MNWIHSIITKISLIFALALLGIGAIFFSLSSHERENNLRHMQDYAHVALRSSFDNTSKQLDMIKLEEMGFILIEDSKLKDKILSIPLPKPNKPFPMRQMQERFRFGVDVIPYGAHIYAILQKKDAEPIVLQSPFEMELFPKILFPLLTFAFVIFL